MNKMQQGLSDTGARRLPPPPIFAVAENNKPTKGGTICLGDIFDEFLFNSNDKAPHPGLVNPQAAGMMMPQGVVMPPQPNPPNTGKAAKTGANTNKKILEDDFEDIDYDSFDGEEDGFDEEGNEDRKKRKRTARGIQRSMTEEQKIERRERNREHAKRSRVRKKFLLESLQHSVHALEEENEKLRSAIREHVTENTEEVLSSCSGGGLTVLASDRSNATKTLDDPDYSLVKALQTAQQNFVISDPSVPDNPIVYASQGFLSLTGYTLEQVLGRNCRFLQGPDTDPRSVERIRKGIEKGEDTTVCLLNYRSDASTFWNQFFIAALRDGDGNVVNYLGVQCKVSEEYAKAFIRTEEHEESKK